MQSVFGRAWEIHLSGCRHFYLVIPLSELDHSGVSSALSAGPSLITVLMFTPNNCGLNGNSDQKKIVHYHSLDK